MGPVMAEVDACPVELEPELDQLLAEIAAWPAEMQLEAVREHHARAKGKTAPAPPPRVWEAIENRHLALLTPADRGQLLARIRSEAPDWGWHYPPAPKHAKRCGGLAIDCQNYVVRIAVLPPQPAPRPRAPRGSRKGTA